MTRELSALFAEQQSNVVHWHGSPIYGLYQFKTIPSRFTVQFIAAKESPTQGVHVKIRGGSLIVNEIEAEDIVLWRDSAPDQIEIQVSHGTESDRSLRIWNVWRGAKNVTHAWLGNAAMRIVEGLDRHTIELCCSDGEGPPNFDDLIVQLSFDESIK